MVNANTPSEESFFVPNKIVCNDKVAEQIVRCITFIFLLYLVTLDMQLYKEHSVIKRRRGPALKVKAKYIKRQLILYLLTQVNVTINAFLTLKQFRAVSYAIVVPISV